jgi:hypothetical protein
MSLHRQIGLGVDPLFSVELQQAVGSEDLSDVSLQIGEMEGQTLMLGDLV